MENTKLVIHVNTANKRCSIEYMEFALRYAKIVGFTVCDNRNHWRETKLLDFTFSSPDLLVPKESVDGFVTELREARARRPCLEEFIGKVVSHDPKTGAINETHHL